MNQNLKRWIRHVMAGLAALTAPPALALSVFACEPEWGALAAETGGSTVQVFNATTAQQDPHHIEARPSLIARLRTADLLVCTGAGLEEGWLPQLLEQANNPRVMPGQPGHFLAADHVGLLEKPAVLDRAQGDVHAAGNPHVHLDPRHLRAIGQALALRLAQVDAANAAAYQQRAADFSRQWQERIARWEERARPLRGLPVAVLHGNWTYLEHWLGLDRVAMLEPKPGVPPSAGHLASVLGGLKARPARVVLAAPHEDPKPTQWLAEQAGIPRLRLPYTVGGADGVNDLNALFERTLSALLALSP